MVDFILSVTDDTFQVNDQSQVFTLSGVSVDIGSFLLKRSAAPNLTLDGEIALDTSVTDFSHGIVKYYSGEEMGIIALPVSEFTSPTGGHVIAYNATNDEFELVSQAGGGDMSASTYDPAGVGEQLVGLTASQTLTNKSIDAANNTISNLDVADFAASAIVLESEGISSNDNDTTIPTSAAVKDYVDNAAVSDTFAVVEVDGVAVSTNAPTLDFDGTDFTVTETPTDSFDISLSAERIQDIAGAMVSGNTETLITVTYQDADGTIDFVVDNDLANYSNTNSAFITASSTDTLTNKSGNISQWTNDSGYITATLTQEQVEDFVGAMVGGASIQTRITVTYDDTNGELDFVVDNDLANYDNTNTAFVDDAGVSSNSDVTANSAARHTQNTDTGTTNDTFSLDSDAANPILIKNSSGALQLRNSGDSAYVDLTAENVTVNGDLTVSGTTTTINTETVTIDDNIIVLNNNETGVPSQNAGIEIERGTSTNATLLWDEGSDRWMAGIAGSEIPLANISGAQTLTNKTIDADNNTISNIALGAEASGDLQDLDNVTITSLGTDELLFTQNGTTWVNQTLAEAGIAATGHTHTLSDITDSGALAALATVGTSEIDDSSVTYAKIQNVSATDRILGRDTAGAGVVEELTPAAVRTMINVEDGADVTDTTNVTAAGALMDSEVSSLSGIKTLTVPDSTTISTFGATLVDDASAAAARTTLGVVIGTDVQAWDADLDTWATKTAPSGTVVGTSDTQTLTNKTLTDSTTFFQDNLDTTKKMQLQLSGISTGTTRTVTLPNADFTPVGLTLTQTLTNKTLTTPTIASFTNATHNHTNAAGGGQLSITGATTGTLTVARGGTGATTTGGAKTNLGFMTDLVDDTTPQLGGALDAQSNGITSVSELGINNASPTYSLDVDSTSRVVARILSDASTGTALIIDNDNGTSRGGVLEVHQGGTRRGVIGVSGHILGNTNDDLALWAETGDTVFLQNSTAVAMTINGSTGAVTIGGDTVITEGNIERSFCIAVTESDTATAVGDGTVAFTVPASMDGMDITDVVAAVHTAGTTGTTDIQIRRRRGTTNADVLSTKVTIDSAETDSTTAATAFVINTSNDDLQEGDNIYVDVDAVSTTPANGLSVTITARMP